MGNIGGDGNRAAIGVCSTRLTLEHTGVRGEDQPGVQNVLGSLDLRPFGHGVDGKVVTPSECRATLSLALGVCEHISKLGVLSIGEISFGVHKKL